MAPFTFSKPEREVISQNVQKYFQQKKASAAELSAALVLAADDPTDVQAKAIDDTSSMIDLFASPPFSLL